MAPELFRRRPTWFEQYWPEAGITNIRFEGALVFLFFFLVSDLLDEPKSLHALRCELLEQLHLSLTADH